jgi:alpha-1,3-glucan synthase
LPNLDPSDVAALSLSERHGGVVIDVAFEGRRGDLRRQAQEWAGLNVDEEVKLLVFVGR